MEDLEVALHMVRSYLQHIIRDQGGEFYLYDFDYRYKELRGVTLSEDHHDLAWGLLVGLPDTILDEINAEFKKEDDQSCP